MKLLRELREKKGLSVRKLAQAVNKSAAFISEIERGIRKPSQATLVDITNILGHRDEIFLTSGEIEPEIENLLADKEVRKILRTISTFSSKKRVAILKNIEKILETAK